MNCLSIDRYVGRAGSPSALLRVLRPSASPFTYAKRPGYPLGATLFVAAGETGSPLSVTDFAGGQAGSSSAVTHFADAQAGCLSALPRVPRPSASSFTYAKRSGNPLGATLLFAAGEANSPLVMSHFVDAQGGSPHSVTQFAAMGAVFPPQRSEGGARRAGDMSGGGYAAPMASTATNRMAKASTAKH
ncbi:hypothetical protein B9Z41_05870 [Limnohabitans sp. JirII-31]|nr:hypothetical protein B9Z41_05870 [Limnohabitans sp. JirII-31]